MGGGGFPSRVEEMGVAVEGVPTDHSVVRVEKRRGGGGRGGVNRVG